MGNDSGVSAALGKAYMCVASADAGRAVLEYKKLSSREAQAAFADHLVGVWAKEFEHSWPSVYELLRLIEEDELYRDPRRVGPKAPGGAATHGKKDCYTSFADYFVDRVGQPLERWAELETTYRYAQTYGPEFFKRPYTEARIARLKHLAGDPDVAPPLSHGGDRRSEAFQADGKNGKDEKHGNSVTYRIGKLKASHPEIVARMQNGEFRSVAEAERAVHGETRGLTRLRRAWSKASEEERATFRAEIC